jgi:hypothetical protein
MGSAGMPYEKPFTVTTIPRQNDKPVITAYHTREKAMWAASGFRAALPLKEGGQVVVHDPEGLELQTWIEHQTGGHFTHHGGFGV